MSKQVWKYVGLMAVISMILAACGAPQQAPEVIEVTKIVAGTPVTEIITATPEPTENPYDDNAPITVWIDADRQPAFDAYVKAHPDQAKLLKAVTVDREQFPAKVLLFNNTNQGWPDVVFAEPRLVGRVADDAHHFPLDLKPWVAEDVLNGYTGMDGCTFGDKVFCLRYDLAMFVTYYNKPLMDEFGYTVPTTWEEYQDLSDKVAAEHPGYYLGTWAMAGHSSAILTPAAALHTSWWMTPLSRSI
jgi:ABC-type glycerol-3-phosphate transport system substrate-binding protein